MNIDKGMMTFTTIAMTIIRVEITPMIAFVINEGVTRPGRAFASNCISSLQLDGDRSAAVELTSMTLILARSGSGDWARMLNWTPHHRMS